jgi:hypothetical protein
VDVQNKAGIVFQDEKNIGSGTGVYVTDEVKS